MDALEIVQRALSVIGANRREAEHALDLVVRGARHAFRAELEASKSSALERVEIFYSDYREEWIFEAHFSTGSRHWWTVDRQVIGDLAGADRAYFDQLLRRQWSRAVAEHEVELQLRPHRERLHRICELSVDRVEVTIAIEEFRRFEQRLRRQVEETSYQGLGIDYVWYDEYCMLTMAHVRRAMDVLRGNERDRERTHKRALTLLREWLSPDQLLAFDKLQAFEVVGGSSGRRYRIRWGTTYNIDELDEQGAPAQSLCFAPVGLEGPLAIGDVLLGQKLALECFEEDAIKIANRRDNLRRDGMTFVRYDDLVDPFVGVRHVTYAGS